jgi:hypothetical protein
MFPMGEAQRVTLAVHLADGAQDTPADDRGDRFSSTPLKETSS